jgi:hypothetical protein
VPAAHRLEVSAALRDSLADLSSDYQPVRSPDALPGGTPASHYGPRHAEQAVRHRDLDARCRRRPLAAAAADCGGSRVSGAATPSVAQVRARRRARRASMLDAVAGWAASLDPGLGVRAVAVFGSVARGDFNDDSDIDVLVVAEHLPAHPSQRLRALGHRPARVEAVVWEPAEYAARRGREPITIEAEACGVWVLGSPETAAGTA